jgi:hypothetical protein
MTQGRARYPASAAICIQTLLVRIAQRATTGFHSKQLDRHINFNPDTSIPVAPPETGCNDAYGGDPKEKKKH